MFAFRSVHSNHFWLPFLFHFIIIFLPNIENDPKMGWKMTRKWPENGYREQPYCLCRGLCRTRWCVSDSGRWILQSAQLKFLITFCSLLNLLRINPELYILHLAKWKYFLSFSFCSATLQNETFHIGINLGRIFDSTRILIVSKSMPKVIIYQIQNWGRMYKSRQILIIFCTLAELNKN
jgi:hypothetical protein